MFATRLKPQTRRSTVIARPQKKQLVLSHLDHRGASRPVCVVSPIILPCDSYKPAVMFTSMKPVLLAIVGRCEPRVPHLSITVLRRIRVLLWWLLRARVRTRSPAFALRWDWRRALALGIIRRIEVRARRGRLLRRSLLLRLHSRQRV